MKFEFDSNNVTELRAVEAAVAVLLDKEHLKEALRIHAEIHAGAEKYERELKDSSPLVAAVAEAQEKLEAAQTIPSPERAEALRVQDQIMGALMPVGGVDIPDDRDMSGAFDKAVERFRTEPVPLTQTEDLDSAGQPWNPELHSSSRAKVADGTWKKKRGVSKTEAPQPLVDAGEFPKIPDAPIPSVPPVPPAPVTPPAPPVPAAPTPSAEQKIWALVTAQVVTINRVLEVAQAHGFADLGALRQADEAKKLEVLHVLEGE